MKLFAVLLFALAAAQAASIPKNPRNPRNLPDRIVLYEHLLPAELREAVKRTADDDSSRIVGGEEALPNSVPFQCNLIIDDAYFCGCSLISPRTVLTAAHCADKAMAFNVTFGDHDLRATEETEVTFYNVQDYRVHGSWRPNLLLNDVAVIYLPEPIRYTPAIQSILLAPPDGELYVGWEATVTGWGKPSDAATSVSTVLRTVNALVITNAECAQTYGSLTVRDTTICISTIGGKGSCNGDSGGPLTVSIGGTVTQIGIVSFGSSQGCEKDFPAAFARVSAQRSWIDANTID